MPVVFGARPAATRRSLASIVRSPATESTVMVTFSPLGPSTLSTWAGRQEPDAFLAQQTLYGVRGVGIFTAQDPRSLLQ